MRDAAGIDDVSEARRCAILALLALISLLSTACAGALHSTRNDPPQAPVDVTNEELADYRRALEEAHQEILARSSGKVPAATADLEAVLSLPIPEHKTIAGALRYFASDLKPGIQTSLDRSALYKPLIDKILDEYKLPRALAYLPVIESAYQPTLTSRAGAHGIWQFMSATAREYGLRVDWWVDERAHPELSTRAAAAYLKDLYARFKDWPLALAAYNAGPARVQRALDKTGARTFWQLSELAALPRETRGYVPTFYATILIVSDPAAHGFRLDSPRDWERLIVPMEGPVSLKYIALISGVDEPLLRQLNPELKRGIVPPGVRSLRVPPNAAHDLTLRARTLKEDDSLVEATSFTLREGDTLQSLSSSLGVPLMNIVLMNGLNEKKVVGLGQTLYLPVRRSELSCLLRRSDAVERLYEVARGDTLYSIARENGLTLDELRDLNQLTTDHILQPGERLRVSVSGSVQAGM